MSRTHPGGGRETGGGYGALQVEATACSRGLRWAKADVRGEWGLGIWVPYRGGKGHGRAGRMDLPGDRPGLPHSGMWALASRQVKEWKGDWYQAGLPRQDPG